MHGIAPQYVRIITAQRIAEQERRARHGRPTPTRLRRRTLSEDGAR